MHNRYKLITKMTADKAKLFLLEPESFFNLSLPPYFNFEKVINDVEGALGGNPLSSYYNPGYRPEQFEHVNYHLYNNKDGKYAWRRHQIIHPAIYVDLVNTITETSNWNAIISRFNEFKKNNKISCISIPKKSLTKKSSTAESILEWWKEIEQESLKKALDYKHIMVTDISNCYSSIYTHSIAWALHTKKVAKANKTNRSLLGNIIDKSIQSMQYGQTNGIPEGSVLMDFIAEMVLGYADELLTEKLKEEKIKDYHILRFRDDYRIFANDLSIISRIGKHLSEVLIELNLKLNSSKTFVSNDLISSAFKSDKLDWNAYKQTIDKEIIDKKNSMHQKQFLLTKT